MRCLSHWHKGLRTEESLQWRCRTWENSLALTHFLRVSAGSLLTQLHRPERPQSSWSCVLFLQSSGDWPLASGTRKDKNITQDPHRGR